MSRPRTDDISLADALAFDSFTPEQKRIAFAGVAMHDEMEDRIERARREAFDDGIEAGRKQVLGEEERDPLCDDLDEQINKLALATGMLPSELAVVHQLRDIRRALTAIVDRLRHG